MKLLYTILILLICCTAAAQSGEIAGIVLDEKKQPVISAVVQVFKNNKVAGGSATGIDGEYSIKLTDTGVYQLRATYIGFDTFLIKELVVTQARKEQNINLRPREPLLPVPQGRWLTPRIRKTYYNIEGSITNAKKEPIPGAFVELYRNNVLEDTCSTQMGQYSVRTLRVTHYGARAG